MRRDQRLTGRRSSTTARPLGLASTALLGLVNEAKGQDMSTSGSGGMLCGYCGRPMFAGIAIGGVMYHQECTQGPGYVAPTYRPTPNGPPMPAWPVTMTEDRVRQIVREEIAASRRLTPVGAGDGNTYVVG